MIQHEQLKHDFTSFSGSQDIHGHPIVQIETEKLLASGVNCYEIATVLLYYSTIPLR